jgi:hypothetical protein
MALAALVAMYLMPSLSMADGTTDYREIAEWLTATNN